MQRYWGRAGAFGDGSGAGIGCGTERRGLGDSMRVPHFRQTRFRRICAFERNGSWPDKTIPHGVP